MFQMPAQNSKPTNFQLNIFIAIEQKTPVSKAVTIVETPMMTEAMKRTCLCGMSSGTFLFMPGGVSHAPTCDGNVYSIAYDYYNTLPGTILLD